MQPQMTNSNTHKTLATLQQASNVRVIAFNVGHTYIG